MSSLQLAGESGEPVLEEPVEQLRFSLELQSMSDRGSGADLGLGPLGLLHARLRAAQAPPPEQAEDRLAVRAGGSSALFFSSVWGTLSRQLEDLRSYAEQSAFLRDFQGRPLSSALPVMIVSAIMGTLYVSFVGFYMPAVGLGSFSVHSLVFHATFACSVCSYHNGRTTDPGAIPDDWRGEPDGRPQFALQAGSSFHPLERKRTTGSWRYCKQEKKFKPDRAHFCRALNRNVLRMDHYCPWLNNCVGYYNYKYFFLFLLYTVVDLNFTTVELARALSTGGYSAGHTFMLYQGSILSGVLSSVLTPFFTFHCWLLAKNMTTIEYCEKWSSGTYTSLYDVGVLGNIASIMGEDWYLWPLPVGGPPGNGLVYALRDIAAFGHRCRCGAVFTNEFERSQCTCGAGSSAAAGEAGSAEPSTAVQQRQGHQDPLRVEARSSAEFLSSVRDGMLELQGDVSRSAFEGCCSLRSWGCAWGRSLFGGQGCEDSAVGLVAEVDPPEATEASAEVTRWIADRVWQQRAEEVASADPPIVTVGALAEEGGLGVDSLSLGFGTGGGGATPAPQSPVPSAPAPRIVTTVSLGVPPSAR